MNRLLTALIWLALAAPLTAQSAIYTGEHDFRNAGALGLQKVIAQDSNGVSGWSVAGNGGFQTVHSIAIPSGELQTGDVLIIRAYWTLTGAGGGNRMEIRDGAGNRMSTTTTTSSEDPLYVYQESTVIMQDAAANQHWRSFQGTSSLGSMGSDGGELTTDFSDGETVTFVGYGEVGDTVLLEAYQILLAR